MLIRNAHAGDAKELISNQAIIDVPGGTGNQPIYLNYFGICSIYRGAAAMGINNRKWNVMARSPEFAIK